MTQKEIVVPYDSTPHLHTGTFLTKEQAEQFKDVFKDLTVVVMCKDCKHYKPYTGRVSGNQYFQCEVLTMNTEPDWFCADGERKSADEILTEEWDADPLG